MVELISWYYVKLSFSEHVHTNYEVVTLGEYQEKMIDLVA